MSETQLIEDAKEFIENTMKFSFNSLETRTMANRMLKCIEFGAKWGISKEAYTESQLREAIRLAREQYHDDGRPIHVLQTDYDIEQMIKNL